jgi:hypothetical protein
MLLILVGAVRRHHRRAQDRRAEIAALLPLFLFFVAERHQLQGDDYYAIVMGTAQAFVTRHATVC